MSQRLITSVPNTAQDFVQGLSRAVSVQLKEPTDGGKVQGDNVSSEFGGSSLRTIEDCIEVQEQFNSVEDSVIEGLQSFIPNEINRWEKLRDQMLPHSDLLKYTRRVAEDDFTSWSEDEAFTSYLLDCLELDLAHGNKIKKQEGDGDKDNKPYDIHTELHRIFPHEVERWETLRDRMQSLPYFDRYVHQNPDKHKSCKWRRDELFTSCLLDRLEEQLEKLQPTNKRDYKPCTLDIDLEGQSQQHHLEEQDTNEEAVVVEEEEEEGEEEEEEEEEEDDFEDYYDDPNDSDYVPEIIEPRPRRKPGRYSLPILPKENSSSSDSDMMDNTDMMPKQKVYQCDICKDKLPTNFQIIHHYLTQHEEVNYRTKSKRRTMSLPPAMKVEDFATALWYCKQCECYVTDLKQHRQEKHQVCEVCGRVCASPQLLQKHVDIHNKTEDERKNLLCDYCGKRYITRTLFKNHLKVHRGEKLKKYACDICNKLFNFSKALKLHKRIHNNEKPFECTYCGRRFTQRYNMFKHTRIHTGVKPYSCDLCEESFNHNISLKNHKKKKHGIDWWNKGTLAVAPLPKSPRRKSKLTRKRKQIKEMY